VHLVETSILEYCACNLTDTTDMEYLSEKDRTTLLEPSRFSLVAAYRHCDKTFKYKHLLMCSSLKVFIQRDNIGHLRAFKTGMMVPVLTLALDGRRVLNVTPRSLYPHVKRLLPIE
jgi:hypothetical protein